MRYQTVRSGVLAFLPVVALAACAQESRQAPVSTAFRGSGPASSEPEPANSLPLGSAVDEPLTGRVGDLKNIRVSPALRAAPRTNPAVSSRY